VRQVLRAADAAGRGLVATTVVVVAVALALSAAARLFA